ncbi:MAG: dihydroorotate dehydrogenase [Gemmatimonadetes bacterium]|nr:dihydroorotate dehydrogenase [Gemmatimonadota bacterium]MBT8403595.1 dihydroorotate dehydrogenase [Gemmatimonadota bacterium]NNF38627.1 dihydroorotate dehydrogenase [Gemmatimonadota bacterium]NNK62953.1 dihydroorotate dehydrogenase [Gemmatimonadota bacterium]
MSRPAAGAELFGVRFRNPVLLAAGTCGFGREVSEVIDLDALGGLVTKSVTLEPRHGNPAPRVAEFGAGMINSIGLANPGVDAVLTGPLPWLAAHVRRARVWVSVAGHTVGEYVELVRRIDGAEGFVGFELNLSCPNDSRLGGRAFSLDREALDEVVRRCREVTERPLLAKLAPNDPDLPDTARTAVAAGADGLTLINTLPGRVLDPDAGSARIGAGQGGVSGPALRPVGVQAVYAVARAVDVPIVGVGGILRAEHALEYLRAGASLVQMGTASFAAPRAAERVAERLMRRPDLPAPWGAGPGGVPGGPSTAAAGLDTVSSTQESA